MGTPIPEEPFVIDPDTLYCVVTDAWTPWPEPPQCGINYSRQFSCNQTGQHILDWLNAGHECTFEVLCAPPLAGFCERIHSITEI